MNWIQLNGEKICQTTSMGCRLFAGVRLFHATFKQSPLNLGGFRRWAREHKTQLRTASAHPGKKILDPPLLLTN